MNQLDSAKREAIKRALRKHGGSIRATAKALGVERRSLYRMLDRLGLNQDRENAQRTRTSA